MPTNEGKVLTQEAYDQASRLLIRVIKALNSSVQKQRESMDAFKDRRVGEGKAHLSAASQHTASALRDLDDFRNLMGIPDFKIVRKKELAERGLRLRSGLATLKERALTSIAAGDDQAVIDAYEASIKKHEQDLESLKSEALAEGFNTVDVSDIVG